MSWSLQKNLVCKCKCLYSHSLDGNPFDCFLRILRPISSRGVCVCVFGFLSNFGFRVKLQVLSEILRSNCKCLFKCWCFKFLQHNNEKEEITNNLKLIHHINTFVIVSVQLYSWLISFWVFFLYLPLRNHALSPFKCLEKKMQTTNKH